MRGTQLVQFPPSDPRFIPAGAGNTQRSQTPEMEIPVYPRWRGEHIPLAYELDYVNGLSPLARGTQTGTTSNGKAARFIPAGAGNTTYDDITAKINAVYPRWRGEHKAQWDKEAQSAGLSPLARGTRDHSLTVKI